MFNIFRSLKPGKKTATAAVGLTLAVGTIAGFEGLETKPYYDVGGVLTYCYGETENAVITAEYTPVQCETLLQNRVKEFNDAVKAGITVDMPPRQEAALTSFAYNIGISAFNKSTLRRKMNAGDTRGACEELDKWVYVGRTYVRGLANRRKIEKEMCLDGIVEET